MRSSPTRASVATRALGALCVLALLLPLAAARSAGTARADTVPAGGAHISPVALPPWAAIGSAFSVGLRVEGDAAIYVRFTVHEPIATLLRFQSTARGEDLGEVIDEPVKLRISDLPRQADGADVATMLLEPRALSAGSAGPLKIMHVPGPGVYPLEITLVGARDTDELDHVVTWLVATDGTASHPLRVAWVWSVRGGPLQTAAGAVDPAALDAIRPRGRLDTIVSGIEAMAPMPTTLRITPELTQSWQVLAHRDHPELRSGVDRLTAVATGAQVLNGPYVELDRRAIARDGFADVVQTEMLTGRDALQSALGVRIDPSTAFVDALDDDALQPLIAGFADRLVLRPQALSDIDSSLRFRSFGLSGTDVTAAQTDDDLLSLLGGTDPPVLRAQRLLAALALVATAVPDETRGVVLAPSDRAPDASAVRLVARGLTDNPVLEPVTLDDWFAAVTTARDAAGARALRRVVAFGRASVAVSRARYDRAQRDLTDLRELVGPRDAHVTRGERALLVVLAAGTSPSTAEDALGAIPAAAHAFLSQVTTATRTVTLTARRARIPLSFTNATGRRVRIRVTLDSDKLLAQTGSTRVSQVVVLPARPTHTTVRFPVETRASGRFRVRVMLSSSDGAIDGGPPATITVNSTAFGSFGSWLTYGALAFLALWWAHHIWRARRTRKTA